jgi:glycosyltransferase involved in cell wall biosynthesis
MPDKPMSDEPLVSVIIPCHDRSRYLPETLDTVLQQEYRNIECVVVDDGSTDDTETVVREFVARDGRVRYFRKDHGGAASARNFGVRKAQGSLIQFFDSDDWLSPEKIAYQVRFLKERNISTDRFLLYADYDIIPWGEEEAEGERQAHAWPGLDKAALMKLLIGRRFGLATPTPLSVCSTLLSRPVAEEFRFREDMDTYEDLECFFRILQSDIEFHHTPVTGFVYRAHSGGLSKDHVARVTGYLLFMESVQASSPEELSLCPNLGKLLSVFAKEGEKELFRRAMRLARRCAVPIYTEDGRDVRRRAVFLDRLGLYYPLRRGGVQIRRLERRVRAMLGTGSAVARTA